MHKHEVDHLVTIDMVPSGKACGWCNEPAEKQLTAIGGTHHNKSGAFCHPCGDEFSRIVVDSQTEAQSGLLRYRICSSLC